MILLGLGAALAAVYVLGFAYTWGYVERENYSEGGSSVACVFWPVLWAFLLLIFVCEHTVVRLVKWAYRKGRGL